MVTKQFIRNRARRTLKEFGITQPPVDVQDIIQRHALTIELVDREESYDGELIAEERKILLNRRKPVVRTRFTLAHELGHWMLFHKERLYERDRAPSLNEAEDEVCFDPNALRKQRDAEAGEFATELLMPTGWVRHDWPAYNRHVPTLSQRYQVSEEAMWIRISELGLLNK